MLTLIVTFVPFYTAYADSSVLIDSTTYFYGNVKFIHKDLEITAKTGVLTPEKVIVRDSVRILKGELEILTDFGEYFWDKQIKLYDGFVAHKKYATLTGKEGKYFEDKIWVSGNVKYKNEDENLLLFGEEGLYDYRTHYGMMTQSPRFEASKDSIEISGDTIKFFNDSLTKVMYNAIINIGEIQCFAESLSYYPKVHKALLYGNPCIISETDSLEGERIKIILCERKINRIFVEGNVVGKKWKF